VNDDVGAISSTWSSLAPVNALMATMPSPPGRFSTTTGWPHFADSLSAMSRALISTPLPGPSGRMSFTARVGQLCAADGRADSANATTAMTEPSRSLTIRMTFPQGPALARPVLPIVIEGGDPVKRKHAIGWTDRAPDCLSASGSAGQQVVVLPQRAVLMFSLSLSRPTAPITTLEPIT
jgi:hypothetical protein